MNLPILLFAPILIAAVLPIPTAHGNPSVGDDSLCEWRCTPTLVFEKSANFPASTSVAVTAVLEPGAKGKCKRVLTSVVPCQPEEDCDAKATMSVNDPGGRCVAIQADNGSWVYTPPTVSHPDVYHRSTQGCGSADVKVYYFPVATGNPPVNCPQPDPTTPTITFGVKCPIKCTDES